MEKNMKNKLTLTAVSLIASAFLVGCGSSDDSSSSTTTQTGTFVDAPVSGLSYTTTSGLNGITDTQGHFNYKAGDSVTFKLGSVELGSSKAAEVITPLNIANNDTAKSARIAYILQNLDTDGNPTDDVIKLPDVETLKSLLTSIDLNDEDSVIQVTADVKNQVEAKLQVDLPDVTIDEARANMEEYTKQHVTKDEAKTTNTEENTKQNIITPDSGFTKEALVGKTLWIIRRHEDANEEEGKDLGYLVYMNMEFYDDYVKMNDYDVEHKGKYGYIKVPYKVENGSLIVDYTQAEASEEIAEYIDDIRSTGKDELKIETIVDGIIKLKDMDGYLSFDKTKAEEYATLLNTKK
jgi:hypothetical protein